MRFRNIKRWADRLFIIFLCFCIIFFSVGTFFLASRDRFSQVENRMLATLPVLSAENLFDGSFTEELGDATRDGIPFRSAFLRLRGLSDLILRGQINNVVFAKGGYLIPRGEYASLSLLERNIEFLEGVTAYGGETVSVAIIPRSIDVCATYLPSAYAGHSDEAWERLGDRLSGAELCGYLRELSESGEEIWYKTDHHWTTLGAYYAYCYLGKSLGYEPYSIEDFERTVICDDFTGSSYSLTGGVAFSSDCIELFRYLGDGEYSVTADGVALSGGLYAFDKLSARDKYAVFLGGNYGRVTIEGEGERPRLLIIKDSYANSLVPFLARHFDIDMIDLRYFSGDAAELYSAIGEADVTLILQGIDTLATTGIGIE